ncbi:MULTISPECIES: transferrin-binding protein-like solute binding protein [unclassified Moraxella]|uniref:transferrin-binding protein-like solute binding protein n=1 Tax=unclassified Moraxella TaxID=2685852 RepID=UPI00359D1475
MSDPTYTLKFTPLPLVLAISTALLTACGGGSFGNPNHIESGINPLVAPKSDKTPDASDKKEVEKLSPEKTLIQPTVGSVAAIPKRNVYSDAEKGEEERKAIGVADISGADADTIKALKEKLAKQYPNKKIYENTKTNKNYKFVKAGWLFSEFYATDLNAETTDKPNTRYHIGDGYVYYYGEQPTMGFAKGKAKYTGHWDFSTDAKRVRLTKTNSGDGKKAEFIGGGSAYGMDGKFGDHLGATSFAETYPSEHSPREGHHKAEFEADFDNKKLTGKLSTQKKDATDQKKEAYYVERYSIDATIKGNRFTGSATVPQGQKDDNLTLFNKDATNRLEGGFYGDKAQELAGKFLTDDNSVFGVFAAKQTGDAEELAKHYDSLYVDITKDEKFNPRKVSSINDLLVLGDISQLVVNSQVIDLLPQQGGKKVSQKTVALPTGQKAVITNFGTLDGVLNVGHIAKTGISNQKTLSQVIEENKAQTEERKKALEEKIAAAKQKAKEQFMDKVESLKDELRNILNEYILAEEEGLEKEALSKTILKQVFSVYGKQDESREKQVVNLLGELAKSSGLNEDDESEEGGLDNGLSDDALEASQEKIDDSIEKIIAIFGQSEQSDPNYEKNWKQLLDKSDKEVLALAETDKKNADDYSPGAIRLAQDQLRAKIHQDQQELSDILSEHHAFALLEDTDASEAQDIPARIKAKILTYYSNTHHTSIEEKIKTFIDAIDKKVKVAKEELAKANGVEAQKQQILKKLEHDIEDSQKALVGLIASGDKANVDNKDNLMVYLLKIPQVRDMTIDDSLNGFYVLGEQTVASEIPKTGQAQYQGAWYGRIHNNRSWSVTPAESKAKFDVNFNDKTLTGSLTEKSSSDPTFTINAKIEGNTFSGTAIANEKGIYVDKYLDIAGGVIKQNPVLSDNLQGSFYGKDAKHLAGGFSFDGVLTKYDGTNTSEDAIDTLETVIGGGVFYGTQDDKKKVTQ